MPSKLEDVKITAGALADPDAVPLTDEEWEAARVSARRGRPPVESPKLRVTIRLDEELVAALRASGPGWQTRVNTMLRKSVLKRA